MKEQTSSSEAIGPSGACLNTSMVLKCNINRCRSIPGIAILRRPMALPAAMMVVSSWHYVLYVSKAFIAFV